MYTMRNAREMNIYDLEGLQAIAEDIIVSAQHSYWNYDDEGNYLDISEDERDRRMFEWIENIKDQPLCVRKCEALKKLSFYDVLDMPLKEIKETFLKDYLRTLRGIFRKGTGNFEHVPSEDIPDEYLDDLLALKYKEYLKLWTMQWDMVKKRWKLKTKCYGDRYMHYCISDIHGEYIRFLAMLEEINFTDDDELYILGDVIDRGPEGVKMLLDIMSRTNVHMLLGNHEHMCLATLGPNNEIGARQLWEQNGGRATRNDLLFGEFKNRKIDILNFIAALPDFIDLEIDGKKFHFVHGCPAATKHDRIWERPNPDAERPFDDATVIVGHMPTNFLNGDDGMPLRIWQGDGIIGIDCGCGDNNKLGQLACLRLEDMKAFYI